MTCSEKEPEVQRTEVIIMESFKYVIKDELGLHARPAGLLVKEAQKMDSKITLKKGGAEADLKKIFAIMKLCVKQGDEVEITVDGGAEQENCEFIKKFFEEHF